MEPLFENRIQLPNYDGYFGYKVYKEYVEYVDLDEWNGDKEPRYWTHQEFYNEFCNQEEVLKKGVIEFLVANKLVKMTDTTQK